MIALFVALLIYAFIPKTINMKNDLFLYVMPSDCGKICDVDVIEEIAYEHHRASTVFSVGSTMSRRRL